MPPERLQTETRVIQLEKDMGRVEERINELVSNDIRPIYRALASMSNRLTVSICLWTLNMMLMGWLLNKVMDVAEKIARIGALLK